MKLRLLCCGLSQLPRLADEENAGGYRLPRVLLARDSQQFLPDFALLLLADEILMDRMTYEGLIRGQIQSGPTVPLLARVLHQEGFLRLEDFDAIGHAQESQLAASLDADLEALESWIPTVRKWFDAWQAHYEGIQATLRPAIKQMRDAAAAGCPVALDYSHQASKFIHDTGGRYQMAAFYAEESLPPAGESLDDDRQIELRTMLSEELRLARGQLGLCQELGAALHDWCDLEPFYQEIVARSGASGGKGKPARQAHRVFELSLPEFSFWHPDNVLRALTDPRVRQWRDKVRESIAAKKPLGLREAEEILAAIRRFDHGVTATRLVTATMSTPPKRREKPTFAAPHADAVFGDAVLLLTSRSRDAQAPPKKIGP